MVVEPQPIVHVHQLSPLYDDMRREFEKAKREYDSVSPLFNIISVPTELLDAAKIFIEYDKCALRPDRNEMTMRAALRLMPTQLALCYNQLCDMMIEDTSVATTTFEFMAVKLLEYSHAYENLVIKDEIFMKIL